MTTLKNSFLEITKVSLLLFVVSACSESKFSASPAADEELANGEDDVAAQQDNDVESFKFALPIKESTEEFSLDGSAVYTSEFSMVGNYVDTSVSARPSGVVNKYSVRYNKGITRSLKRRLYDNKTVDIVMVIDNSSSMGPDQDKLAVEMPTLKTALSALDWRVIVVSTDVADRCYSTILDKNSSDAAMRSAVQLGSSGSDREAPLYRAMQIFNGSCAGATIRTRAATAMFILTNEDECSTGTESNCPVVAGKPAGYVNSFRTVFNAIPGMSSSDLTVGLIAWQPSAASCPTAISKAQYITSNASPTVSGSICSASFQPTFSQFTQKIANLSDPFSTNVLVGFSAAIPNSHTVVFADGTFPLTSEVSFASPIVSLAKKTQYYGKAVVITVKEDGPAFPKIVKYATTCNANLKYIEPFTYTDLNSSVSYQSNSTKPGFPAYVFRPKVCEFEFNAAPTGPFSLTLPYDQSVAPVSTIQLRPNFLAESVHVFIAGTEVYGFTIDANGLLKLNSPESLSPVEVRFKVLNDPTLRFEVGLLSDATSISVVDKATGAPVLYVRDKTAVVIDRTEVANNRGVVVSYKSRSKSRKPQKLLFKPKDPDALISSILDQCPNASANDVYNDADNTIDLSSCAASLAKASIAYEHFSPESKFVLPLDAKRLDSIKKIKVYNNDVLISKFEKKGATVEISERLQPGFVRVDVELSK